MRYLPITEANRKEMLSAIGANSIEELYSAVPSNVLKGNTGSTFDLPNHKGEIEVEKYLKDLAKKNTSCEDNLMFIGAGCYNHHIPASVDYLIQRGEYLTSYTPYQPEIAQGNLQVIFEFQSIVCAITGMEVANASLYDGATSLAEAVLMCGRVTERSAICVLNSLHPDYKMVLDCYCENAKFKVDYSSVDNLKLTNETSCLVVQIPNYFGETGVNLEELRKKCDEVGAMLVVVNNEILAFGVLPAPSEADIVCGEARSLGVAMSYGGPHLGYFAARKKYLRQMPGRLCGATKDADGKAGFVLTLSAREQHIRREKATSNICSNQGLCALAFTIHATLLGEIGFMKLAQLNHNNACLLADKLAEKGFTVKNKTFFNEFVFSLSNADGTDKIDKKGNTNDIVKRMQEEHSIFAGLAISSSEILVAATEINTPDQINQYVNCISGICGCN